MPHRIRGDLNRLGFQFDPEILVLSRACPLDDRKVTAAFVAMNTSSYRTAVTDAQSRAILRALGMTGLERQNDWHRGSIRHPAFCSPPPAPALFSSYSPGPVGSPHAWLTIDEATIHFDFLKSAPEEMIVELASVPIQMQLKHFIQGAGYATDDEGGPVIADPDATPEEMAFYWYGTGGGQTLHLTFHHGGVFGTSYGPRGSFFIEPRAGGLGAVRVRAVNPESWIQHPELAVEDPTSVSSPGQQDPGKTRSLWAPAKSPGPPAHQPPRSPSPPLSRPRFDQKGKSQAPYCREQPIDLRSWDPSCTLEPLGTGSSLDILVLYTPAALELAESQNPLQDPLISMRARIENEVNTTNTIFRESGIEGVQLFLKGIEPTPGGQDDGTPDPNLPDNERAVEQYTWLVGSRGPQADPNEPGDFVERPATGNPAVEVLREAYQADIVGMVQASFYGFCGIAHQTNMRYKDAEFEDPPVGSDGQARRAVPGPTFYHAAAFIADMNCAAATWDFAHEVLHILGVQHDPGSDVAGDIRRRRERAACPNAFGWRQPGGDPNPMGPNFDTNAFRRHRHRDLMAYTNQNFNVDQTGLPPSCYAGPMEPPFYGFLCPRIDRLANRELEWNGYPPDPDQDPPPDYPSPYGVQPFGSFVSANPQLAPPGNRHRLGSEPGVPDLWRGTDARFTAIRVSRLVADFCSRPDLGFADGFEAQP